MKPKLRFHLASKSYDIIRDAFVLWASATLIDPIHPLDSHTWVIMIGREYL